MSRATLIEDACSYVGEWRTLASGYLASIAEHVRVTVASLLVDMKHDEQLARLWCAGVCCRSNIQGCRNQRSCPIRNTHSSTNAVKKLAGSVLMRTKEVCVPIRAIDLLSMTLSSCRFDRFGWRLIYRRLTFNHVRE
jgi:hypothetical protein